MSDPDLSVVVASVNGMPYLGWCLNALTDRCPEAEVVVADWTDEATRREVRERWPGVRLLSFDEPAAVPELRAAGIAAARAPYVALIEDHCVVAPGWSRAILDAHAAGHPVVGGAVVNAMTERSRDWAAFLCEYSNVMEPVPEGPVDGLPGMNVSYDRSAIAAMAQLLAEGRWESWLHPHLQREGFELWSDPRIELEHAKDFGFREFVSQRYHYARSHAGMRNPELGAKRVLYTAGSPAIVPMFFRRIAGDVRRKGTHRAEFRRAAPLILLYLCVWALGEGIGYAAGGGRSILKVR